MADEEHTHITHEDNKEHSYTHDHEQGHEPHDHGGEGEEIVEIWEDDGPAE